MNYRRLLGIILLGVLLGTPIFVTAQDADPVASAGLTIHVVQRGETLYQIALSYGMNTQELAELNGILDVNNIQVGQRLLVPTEENPLPPEHIVQAGETLSTIAELYQLDVNSLIAFNEIENANRIYVGQVLRLNPSTVTSTTAADLETLLPTFGSSIHVVSSGETLFKIATRYGLTVNDLVTANSIDDPTRIYGGQQLLIPGVGVQPLEIELPAPITELNVRPLSFKEGETGSVQLLTNAPATVSGTFLGRELRVISLEEATHHIMLVPIPLFTEAGIYPFRLQVNDTSLTFNVQVVTGAYGTQDLPVSAEMEQLLAPAVQDTEIALIIGITENFSAERYFDSLFSLPAAAPMNGPYGTRRSYNGGPVDAFHSGTDFAAAPETPIYAAAPGQVVLADRLNIRGNTVIINHGWGIYTLYAHQTALNVSVGQMVTTGQIIGTAGSTGRVTGPHLHWEVWLNGVPVNPLQWVQYSIP